MAASLDEELLLRQCVKEIIDEKYSTQLHELNEKLALARSREKELQDRLGQYDKELEHYRECHKCHKEIFEKRDATTQTKEENGDKKQPPKHQNVTQPSQQPQPPANQPSTSKSSSSPSSKYLCSSSRQQVRKSTSSNNEPSTSKQPSSTIFKQPLPPQIVPVPPPLPKQIGSMAKKLESIMKQTLPSTSEQSTTEVSTNTSIKSRTTQTSKGNLSSVKDEMNMEHNNSDHNQNVSERNGRESVDSMEIENEPEFIDLTIDSD